MEAALAARGSLAGGRAPRSRARRATSGTTSAPPSRGGRRRPVLLEPRVGQGAAADVLARRARRSRASAPTARWSRSPREHDLYVVDVSRPAASGGSRPTARDELLNGMLDWVYQEEVYGRGNFKGYWWSPDSRSLAFLQLDEKGVPEVHAGRRHPVPARRSRRGTTRRPATPTRRSKLGVVARRRAARRRCVDLDKYAGVELLIVDVSWTPDGQQRRVPGAGPRADAGSTSNSRRSRRAARCRTLFRETTKAWVDNHGAPAWLKDGSFLWLSRAHRLEAPLPLRGRRHAASRQVTNGEWEVRDAARRRRDQGLRLLLRHRAQPDRPRRLPRRARRQRARAADAQAAGTHAAKLQPVVHALPRHLERRDDADAGPAPPRRRHARCA